MEVLIVGHHEVAELLPMNACIEVMAQVFETLHRDDAILPLRQVVWQPDRSGAVAVMPSYVGAPRAFGAKVITVFPGNAATPYESHQGAVLLFEAEHGRLLAMIDASSVTAIRTAAVSALATRLMARPEAGDLAILGTGTQAVMHLEAMRCVRPLRRVRVWGRNPDGARRFAEREGARHGLAVEVAGSVPEAVAGAEIICTTTGATAPILQGEWLAPGAHINAIGAAVQGFRELDADAVMRSRLIVDRRESALNEADEVRLPLREGLITEEHIRGDLGEVAAGTVAGRTSSAEVTLFKSLGLSVEDVASAHYIYQQASAQRKGARVEFAGERHT